MTHRLLAGDAAIRLAAYLAAFALMAGWEALAARRPLRLSRRARWPGNLLLAALDAAVVRLLLPAALIETAISARSAGWGLLPRLDLAGPVGFAVAIGLLDLVVYLQHVLSHAVPLLWRFHMVHHADLDLDVTTGTRFHPVEILGSALLKVSAVAALGPDPAAVLAFEVLLNVSSLFNHGNVRIPARADRLLRWIVVTPDMHRIHHSTVPGEHHRNFGFALPWWDRLLGTYRAEPAGPPERMRIGLEAFQAEPVRTLGRMLALPFGAAAAGPAGRLDAGPREKNV